MGVMRISTFQKKMYTLVFKLTGYVKENPLQNAENLANEFKCRLFWTKFKKLETLYPMFQITVLVKQIL